MSDASLYGKSCSMHDTLTLCNLPFQAIMKFCGSQLLDAIDLPEVGSDEDGTASPGRLLFALGLLSHAADMTSGTRRLLVQALLPWVFRVTCSQDIAAFYVHSEGHQAFLSATSYFFIICHKFR